MTIVPLTVMTVCGGSRTNKKHVAKLSTEVFMSHLIRKIT